MNIVSIGGGNLGAKETLAIDKFIVRLTKKKKPHALFIPTATCDDKDYIKIFEKIYGQVLGCKTDVLLLFSKDKNRKIIKEKIKKANLVYVGGGNTLRMMKLWKNWGVNSLLRRKAKTGAIMAGLSAGAICWYQYGHSDSRAYSGKKKWSHIRVKALGLIRHLYCPHLDKEKRHSSLVRMIRKTGDLGIACDNNAAVWYKNKNEAIVLTSRKKARAYIYKKVLGSVYVTPFKKGQNIFQSGI